MIYLAAMTEGELTQRDFLRYIGSNPVHASTRFDGQIELAGQSVPEGHMKRFIWRMQDQTVTSNDIAVVVIFNQTRELRDFEEHKFMHKRREKEIAEFIESLASVTFSKEADTYITTEGNLVYILRDCDTKILSGAFSVHSRRTIQKV